MILILKYSIIIIIINRKNNINIGSNTLTVVLLDGKITGGFIFSLYSIVLADFCQ